LYWDDVFYRITFYDPATQSIGGNSAWTECKDGRLDSTLTITVGEFTAILQNAQPGWSGGPTELYWYAVATDTTYETPAASFSQDSIRGFRIFVNAHTNAMADPPTAQLPVLEQNTPNPFRESTGIHFTSVAAGPVALTVHDMLGRRVGTLVDSPLAPGIHSVRFDAGNLPAGTYLCRLQCDGVVRWRSMVVMR
jgi:hypothetical protein